MNNTNDVNKQIESFDESLDFKLPGFGEPLESCGQDVILSHLDGLDLHWIRRRRSCHRIECPVCYPSWIKREAMAIKDRISVYYSRTGRMPVHYVISPPQSQEYHTKPLLRDLRRSAYLIGKQRGIRGGCLIFHERSIRFSDPKEYERSHCSEGPHFHVIGDGWLSPRVKEFFLKDGWIVKNLRIRKVSHVFGTAAYILEHAAIPVSPGYPAISQGKRSPMATVTWFGTMSYNKLKIEKFKGSDVIFCPICKLEIEKSDWFISHFYSGLDPPEENFGVSNQGKNGIILERPLTEWSGFY
jgi:hypothetical protein